MSMKKLVKKDAFLLVTLKRELKIFWRKYQNTHVTETGGDGEK